MSLRRSVHLSCKAALPLLAAAAVSCTGLSLHAQQVQYTSARRNAELRLPVSMTSGPEKLRSSVKSSGRAISVAVGDFSQANAPDLITGYAVSGGGALALQHGFAGATAPGQAEAAAMIAGQQVAPFAADASVFALPVAPDLLQTADLDLNGTRDILAASKGDTALYLLKGDGLGGFSAPAALALNGKLHSLALWTSPDGMPTIAAGICGDSGCGIQLLSPDGTTKGFVALPAKPTALESGRVNNGGLADLLVIAGEHALVLDGDSVLTGAPKLETLPVQHAVAIAPGSYVWDRRGMPQIAVLSEDATLSILARPGLNKTDLTREEIAQNRLRSATHGHKSEPQPKLADRGWTVVESTPGIGPGHDSKAVMLRGKFTVAGADDLVVLSGGQYVEIAHTTAAHDGQRISTAAVSVDSTSRTVTAAVPARVTPDSRLGVVSVSGDLHPLVTAPNGYHKQYYVNSYTDAINIGTGRCVNNLALNATPLCNLRDALVLANADRTGTSATSPDRIYMPATGGTYSFAVRNTGATYDAQGDVNYHLNIETNVNIIGQATCTVNAQGVATACPTIIDAGQKDIVFALNSSAFDASDSDFQAYSVYMSNLQLQNGVNNNNPIGTASGPAAANNGGLIYGDLDGGNLLLNTMVLTNGLSNYAYGNGGGGTVSTLQSAEGTTLASLEIDNTTLSNSRSVASGVDGGGLFVAGDTNLTMTNGMVTNNSTPDHGGGIFSDYIGADSLTAASNLTNITVTGNIAGQGGGINFENAVTMSRMTVTGNNATATTSTYNQGAGGIYLSSGQSVADSITASTIAGNTLGSGSGVGGAGIAVFFSNSAVATPLTLQYNRIHGNTGGLAVSTGFEDGAPGSTAEAGYIVATNNWWGCNGDPQTGGSPCDTAFKYGSAALTTSPYTTLKLALSSATPTAGSSIVATGSLGQNSSGTVYTAANDTAYLATPITTFTLTNAGTVTYNPSATTFSSTAATGTSYAAATATGTAVAGNSGTATLTVDGVTLTSSYSTPAYTTTTAVSVGATSLALGGTTSVSASVTSPNGTPAGSVTFTDSVSGTSTTTTVALNGTSAMYTFNASRAGTHTITAVFTPSSTTYAASSDTTGKTITVAMAPATTGNIYDSTQTGKPLSVAVGGSLAMSIIYPFPGTVAPTGALTITVNGSSTGVGTPSCINKSKHANCSFTFTDSQAAGNYTVSFTVAADTNYNAITGSAPITVTAK